MTFQLASSNYVSAPEILVVVLNQLSCSVELTFSNCFLYHFYVREVNKFGRNGTNVNVIGLTGKILSRFATVYPLVKIQKVKVQMGNSEVHKPLLPDRPCRDPKYDTMPCRRHHPLGQIEIFTQMYKSELRAGWNWSPSIKCICSS